MANRQMIQAKVASIAKREGLRLKAEFSGDTVTLIQDGDPIFESRNGPEFWIKLTGFEVGAKAKGDGLAPGRVTVRWSRSESLAEGGGVIVGWASCHLGPVYLNNIMLVQRLDGELVVMWPQMRDKDHYWWRPDPKFAPVMERHILEAVLGEGVNSNGVGSR